MPSSIQSLAGAAFSASNSAGPKKLTRKIGSKYPASDAQKCVQKRTLETPKKTWSSGGIQKTSRRTNTVVKARAASASSYFWKRAGTFVESQSRATNRAKENPTTLAAMVPVIESANATGQAQINGAATMKTVPGTPNGCSVAYATTNAR